MEFPYTFRLIRGTHDWAYIGIVIALTMFAYVCYIFPIKPVFAESVIKDTRVHERYCAGLNMPCVDSIAELELDFPETEKKHGIVSGYDIRSYATNPKHEANVNRIYQNVEVSDSYIQRIAKGSPVTIKMVVDSSKKYAVDPKMILAIMQEDSQFGTVGVGARTNNPGNVSNYCRNGGNACPMKGNSYTFQSWEDGVNAVAKWLSNHRT